jgi:microcystin-dependent protein
MAEDTPTANRPDESISHYHVQVATTNLFTVLLDEAKHITHRQHRWKDTSPGTARFARVRSVDSLGGVSAWQPGATGLSVTAGDDGVPIGHIQKVHHAVATPPALTTGSFLWCNGAAVSRTTFAALFAVISTTAGAGDGATTFNLPDHRGKHALGVSTHATAGHRTLGARDDADTSGIKVDHAHDVHGGDTHPDTDDHAPGVGQLNVSASDNPESGHVHNASNISIGASFGNVQAGTQAAQAAGPNHGHGASGFTGTLQFAHQHGISTGWGGRHPWLGQHPGKPQHGANNAPWLAVHYIIKAL